MNQRAQSAHPVSVKSTQNHPPFRLMSASQLEEEPLSKVNVLSIVDLCNQEIIIKVNSPMQRENHNPDPPDDVRSPAKTHHSRTCPERQDKALKCLWLPCCRGPDTDVCIRDGRLREQQVLIRFAQVKCLADQLDSRHPSMRLTTAAQIWSIPMGRMVSGQE